MHVLERLVAQRSEAGEIHEAIETGEQILRLDPLYEPAVRRLMRLYAESGRRSTAIQLYRTLSDALKADLDAQPEAETRATFADIVHGGEQQASEPGNATAELPPAPSVRRPKDTVRPQPLPAHPTNAGGILRQFAMSWRGAVLAGGIAAAVAAIFLAQQFIASVEVKTAAEGVQPSAVLSPTPVGAVSIAVLPFTNLSADPEQEFFSDGITEEITAALARIPDLTVIGRTSAFQFKGKSQDLRTIGQALGAGYLIEGSVRKAGDRVRITAQLIRADSGAHLWAENYERDLTDIFAVQQEIAGAIAGALRIPLALQPDDKPVLAIDAGAYESYLRAKAMLRGQQAARGLQQVLDVVKLLEQVVERDPQFAPGWATLAGAYDRMPLYSTALLTGSSSELRNLSAQYAQRAGDAAQRAIRLDPNLAEGYMSLAFTDVSRRNMSQALDNITRALSLDPTNPDVLAAYRNILLEVGRVEESLAAQQRVVALEPFVPRFKMNLATNLWLVGQDDAAIEILSASAPADRAAIRQVTLAMIYAARGRYGEAADTLMSLPPELFPAATVETAARLLRAAPSANSSGGDHQLGALGFIYLHIGQPDRVVEFYEATLEAGYSGMAPLWHKAYEPVRKTEQFKALVQRARLPEFWRARGWPAFCRPTGADDFACT